MAYSTTKTRKQMLATESHIPGSWGWAKEKSMRTGQPMGRTITRNSLKFKRKPTSYTDFNSIAYSKGWDYDDDTKSWSHPQYPNLSFPSILQRDGLPIPYANNNDPKGLAFVYDPSIAGGLYTTIRQNRWISEEFDTRRGRRRTLWEKKKEEKRKFLSSRQQREEMAEEFGEAD